MRRSWLRQTVNPIPISLWNSRDSVRSPDPTMRPSSLSVSETVIRLRGWLAHRGAAGRAERPDGRRFRCELFLVDQHAEHPSRRG
jgi:hypothetical protein